MSSQLVLLTFVSMSSRCLTEFIVSFVGVGGVCVCVRACAPACVRARVRACVRACVCVRVDLGKGFFKLS